MMSYALRLHTCCLRAKLHVHTLQLIGGYSTGTGSYVDEYLILAMHTSGSPK